MQINNSVYRLSFGTIGEFAPFAVFEKMLPVKTMGFVLVQSG